MDPRDGDIYRAVKAQLSQAVFSGEANVPDGAIMTVLADGETRGAMLFSWYSTGVVEVSMATFSGQWITSGAIREMMDYVFSQLEARAIMARTVNDRARRILGRMGLAPHPVPHIRAGETEVFFIMTAADWRASRFNKG